MNKIRISVRFNSVFSISNSKIDRIIKLITAEFLKWNFPANKLDQSFQAINTFLLWDYFCLFTHTFS